VSWKYEKLTDISTVTTGKWDANHSSVNGKFRFYTCASKFLLSDTKRYEGKNIILPGNGANVGDVYFYDGEFDAYQRTYVISNIKIIPEYLYYHLQSNWEETNRFKQYGSATNFLKIGNFKDYIVGYPPLPVQQNIVAKLDAIFAEIDTVTEAAQANAKNAEALFVSYLNKICNEDFIKSKKYKLGEVCTFQGGSQPAKSFFQYELNDENIRFIQIRDYKSDKNLVYIPKTMAKRFCNATEVMIGRYGPPVFQILRGITGSYNVALMKAIPQEKFLTKDYLYYFLKNPLIQDYVISLSNRAAGQSGMNKETIEPYEIYLPTLEEQITAVIKIELCSEYSQKIIKSNQLKINNLSFLKQSILQKAFSGELVKD
jgi:type I restriction enzyme S subunit